MTTHQDLDDFTIRTMQKKAFENKCAHDLSINHDESLVKYEVVLSRSIRFKTAGSQV